MQQLGLSGLLLSSWLSSALGMSYKCVTVVISRVSQYRFVVLLSGASAVGLYRKHVSIPVCVMVCTVIRV